MEYRTRVFYSYFFFNITKHAALLICPTVPDTVAELILGAPQTPMTIPFRTEITRLFGKQSIPTTNTVDIVI